MHFIIIILSHIPISGIHAFIHYHLELCSYLRNTCIPSLYHPEHNSYHRNACIPSLQSCAMFLSQEYMYSFITILRNIPISGIHVFLHYHNEWYSNLGNTCIPSLQSWEIFQSQEYMHSFIITLNLIPISGINVFLHHHPEHNS